MNFIFLNWIWELKKRCALCPLQILNISCIFSTVWYRFSSLNINLQQLMIYESLVLNEFKRKLVSIFCSFYCRIIFSSNNPKYSYKKLKMFYLLWLSSFCIFEMLCPLAQLKYTLIYLNVCIIDEQFINNKNSFLHYIIFNICICLKHLNLQKLVIFC